ncbi:MAG: MFS transporter [Pseudomonadota bacterium]
MHAGPRHSSLTLLILALSATLAPVSMDMLTPSLAGMSLDLQASPRLIELSLYSFLVGYGVAPSVWGHTSDRAGRRPVMFTGMLLYCISSSVCAFVDDAHVLVGIRFLQGLGAGAGATMARAVVRDLYGAQGTTKGMARMMSLMAIVPIFMPILGGLLAQWFGWQACFILMTAIGAFSVAAYFYLVPETRRAPAAEINTGAESVRQILLHPVFAQHTLCNMFSITTLVIFGANFAFLTATAFDFNSSKNGLVLALFNASIALGTQLVWLLMPRFQAHRSIVIGALACTVGWMYIGLMTLSTSTTVFAYAPGLIVAGSGAGVIMSLSAGAALAPFEYRTGLASSLYLLVQSAGSSAISLTVGWMLPQDMLAVTLAMAACALLALLSKCCVGSANDNSAGQRPLP